MSDLIKPCGVDFFLVTEKHIAFSIRIILFFFYKKVFVFTFLNYVYVCGCVHINAVPTEASDPLEVESKVALSQLTLVL